MQTLIRFARNSLAVTTKMCTRYVTMIIIIDLQKGEKVDVYLE